MLELSSQDFLVKVIQQKRKKSTVFCSINTSNKNICITTHVEEIIKAAVYEYWCPLSKRFFIPQKNSLGDFYFRILKITQIKHRKNWAPALIKMFWVNHFLKGVGLTTDEDIFQKVYLSKDNGDICFIAVDHAEIADYYQVTTEELERIIAQ